MNLPKIAGNTPIKVRLEKNKKYAWCSCGLSDKQPYCNGSHKETEYSPIIFSENKNSDIFLCTCKKSSNPPYCDGSHKKI